MSDEQNKCTRSTKFSTTAVVVSRSIHTARETIITTSLVQQVSQVQVVMQVVMCGPLHAIRNGIYTTAVVCT